MTDVQGLIAPDGGWGWMVVLAFAIANMIIIPLIHGFGLIFKDTFTEVSMSNTNVSLILNINTSFGMLLGLVTGPLLRRYGFRKMAFIGGALTTIGVISTAPARTFPHFIVTYSIITSIGFSFIFASYHLALNTYFKKRRNRASGIAMTITGISPIFVPHMITHFLHNYEAFGCMLIFGGIVANTLPTALLLQPVKWHMKKEYSVQELKDIKNSAEEPMLNEDKEKTEKNDNEVVIKKDEIFEEEKSERTLLDSVWDVFLSEEEHEYLERRLSKKRPVTMAFLEDDLNLENSFSKQSKNSVLNHKRHSTVITKSSNLLDMFPQSDKIQRRYASQPITKTNTENNAIYDINSHRISVVMDYLGSTYLDDNKYLDNGKLIDERCSQKKLTNSNEKPKTDNQQCCQRFTEKIIQFFDLKLLADTTYIAIMIGISTAIFSEMNFSMLTPFILGDMGLDKNQIATMMSAIAISDIITRFVCPFIGDYFKQTPRMMFVHSVVMLILIRTGLIYSNSYTQIMLCCLVIGVSKGIRTVYSGLIIPNYVPLDRLPCAFGLQNVSNGIFVLGFGPLLGVIRDFCGSYVQVMYFLNAVMFFVIILWGMEHWWKKSRTKKFTKTNNDKIPE